MHPEQDAFAEQDGHSDPFRHALADLYAVQLSESKRLALSHSVSVGDSDAVRYRQPIADAVADDYDKHHEDRHAEPVPLPGPNAIADAFTDAHALAHAFENAHAIADL